MRKSLFLTQAILLALFVCVAIFFVLFYLLLNLDKSTDLYKSTDLDESTIVGSYVGSYEVFPKITARLRSGIYKGGTHLLELKSDKTYTYVYNPVDGNSVEINGLWEFKRYRDRVVVLHDFFCVWSAVSAKRPGTHVFPIQKKFCRPIRIDLDSDVGFYWINQKKPNHVEN